MCENGICVFLVACSAQAPAKGVWSHPVHAGVPAGQSSEIETGSAAGWGSQDDGAQGDAAEPLCSTRRGPAPDPVATRPGFVQYASSGAHALEHTLHRVESTRRREEARGDDSPRPAPQGSGEDGVNSSLSVSELMEANRSLREQLKELVRKEPRCSQYEACAVSPSSSTPPPDYWLPHTQVHTPQSPRFPTVASCALFQHSLFPSVRLFSAPLAPFVFILERARTCNVQGLADPMGGAGESDSATGATSRADARGSTLLSSMESHFNGSPPPTVKARSTPPRPDPGKAWLERAFQLEDVMHQVLRAQEREGETEGVSVKHGWRSGVCGKRGREREREIERKGGRKGEGVFAELWDARAATWTFAIHNRCRLDVVRVPACLPACRAPTRSTACPPSLPPALYPFVPPPQRASLCLRWRTSSISEDPQRMRGLY